MKKIAIIIALLIPVISFAAIDANLKYGMRGTEVQELQEFLIARGFLKGTATGNFYSLTLSAVKNYQTVHTIPATGYVGVMTRGSINKELLTETQEAATAEIEEVGTIVPIQYVPVASVAPAKVIDVVPTVNMGRFTSEVSGMIYGFSFGTGVTTRIAKFECSLDGKTIWSVVNSNPSSPDEILVAQNKGIDIDTRQYANGQHQILCQSWNDAGTMGQGVLLLNFKN